MGHPYRPHPKRETYGFVQLTPTLAVRENQILRIEQGEIVLRHGQRVPLTSTNEAAVREVLE